MNVLLIMRDEHRRDAMGCAGHAVVCASPLDALDTEDIRFTHAYRNRPLCIPGQANFATSQHIHELECWDNDKPHREVPDNWGSYLPHFSLIAPPAFYHMFAEEAGDLPDEVNQRELTNQGERHWVYEAPIRLS